MPRNFVRHFFLTFDKTFDIFLNRKGSKVLRKGKLIMNYKLLVISYEFVELFNR
jgi:hypothetical protein